MHAGSAFYCSRLRCTFPPFGWYTSTSSLFFVFSKAVIVSICHSPLCLLKRFKDGLHLDLRQICVTHPLMEQKQEYMRIARNTRKVLKTWRRDQRAPRRLQQKVRQESNQRLLCIADLVPNGPPVLESIYRTWRPLTLQGKAALRLWFQCQKELYWYQYPSDPLLVLQTCDHGLETFHSVSGACV